MGLWCIKCLCKQITKNHLKISLKYAISMFIVPLSQTFLYASLFRPLEVGFIDKNFAEMLQVIISFLPKIM